MKKKIRIGLALFLPVQIAAVYLLCCFPAVVDNYYSHGLFPEIALWERILLGRIHFSVGDLLYSVFGIILICWFVRRIRTRFKRPKKWGLQALSAISVLYFCFHFFWGLNYDRIPLHQSLG